MATRQQVVEMVVGDGKTPAQVSEELGLHISTIYHHLQRAGKPRGRGYSGRRGRPAKAKQHRTPIQVSMPRPQISSSNGSASLAGGTDAAQQLATALGSIESQIAAKMTEQRGLEVQHRIITKALADLSAIA